MQLVSPDIEISRSFCTLEESERENLNIGLVSDQRRNSLTYAKHRQRMHRLREHAYTGKLRTLNPAEFRPLLNAPSH